MMTVKLFGCAAVLAQGVALALVTEAPLFCAGDDGFSCCCGHWGQERNGRKFKSHLS